MSSSRKPPFFWAALLLTAVALGLWTFAAATTARYGALVKAPGWTYAYDSGAWRVNAVEPGGVADGRLEPGDRLLALNGSPSAARDGPGPRLRDVAPGTRYTLVVARDGHARDVTLPLTTARDWARLLMPASRLLASAVWLFVAALIGLRCPEKAAARLGSVAFFLVSSQLTAGVLMTSSLFLRGAALVPYVALVALSESFLPVGYHFYSRFPPGVPRQRLWRALAVVLYAWFAVILIRHGVPEALRVPDDAGYHALLAPHYTTFTLVSLALTVAVVIRNYRVALSPDQQRRLRWVAYGTVGSLIPLALFWTARLGLSVFHRTDLLLAPPMMSLSFLTALVPAVIPLTLGYAIVRHRVFDIAFVIRRGVQYALARGALTTALAVPILILAYASLRHPEMRLAEIVSIRSWHLYAIVAAAAGLKFRVRLLEAIDRRFFREAYQSRAGAHRPARAARHARCAVRGVDGRRRRARVRAPPENVLDLVPGSAGHVRPGVPAVARRAGPDARRHRLARARTRAVRRRPDWDVRRIVDGRLGG